MKNTTYHVYRKEEGSPYDTAGLDFVDENKAINKAREWAKEHPDQLVFISFFRKNDGQKGYINRDGAGFTGQPWTY